MRPRRSEWGWAAIAAYVVLYDVAHRNDPLTAAACRHPLVTALGIGWFTTHIARRVRKGKVNEGSRV